MKSLRVKLGVFPAAVTLALLKVSTSSALEGGVRSGMQAAHGEGQPVNLFGDGAIFGSIVDIMLYLIGAIAVVMIIIGGLRYVISGGNATSVTAAKNTILYAIVGIVVALLAYAIIDFVLSALESSEAGTAGL